MQKAAGTKQYHSEAQLEKTRKADAAELIAWLFETQDSEFQKICRI